MFFAQEYIQFSIVDVFRIEQDINRKFVHPVRPYSSISLRYDSEAAIECYGETHDVSNTVSYFPAQMPYTRLARRDNLIVIHFENHSHVSTQLESFLPAHPEAFRALFEQALTCWNARGPGFRYRTASVVHQILAMAYEENRVETALPPLVEAALKEMEKNAFRKDFHVASLASELHVSAAHLRMLFNGALGVSPKHFVLQQRIQKAISLLKTNYFTIAEVADQVGFSDPKHFSVQFKKITGISPRAFKKQTLD